MLKETDYAWAAGLIDGEGCIYIHKYNSPKEGKNPWYSLRVFVGMTNFDVINHLKDLFGGSISYSKRGNDKNQARWMLSSFKAVEFLKKIEKYLICKKKEALMGIEFGNLPLATQWSETPEWLLKERDRIHILMKETKKIEFDIPKIKKVKDLKKDKKFTCPICGTISARFSKNGRIRKTCSRKCAGRKFTNEQEIEIIKYKDEGNSIRNVMDKYAIPKGTLEDILRRRKTYNLL